MSELTQEVPPPRARKAPAPAPLGWPELASVQYEPAPSTRGVAVYTAQSDRLIGVRYTVRHEPAAGLWTCDCPGGRFPSCKHRQRAAMLARVRWWLRVLGDCPAGELAALLPAKRTQAEHGPDADDAHAALLALDCLLAGTRQEAA